VYEEADCRLYYTPEMTVDATAIWKAVADAQWGGKGKCVTGKGDGGYKERREVTTSLGRSVSKGGSRKRSLTHGYDELIKTFKLETENQLGGDGFMLP
jgi:hypothetical protein